MKIYIPIITLFIILVLASACNSDDEIADPIDRNAILCAEKEISFIKRIDSLECAMTGGVPPYTFLWSSGERTASIVPTTTGMHSCSITDAEGCQAGYSIFFELPFDDGCALDLTITEDIPGQLSITPINATGDIVYNWSTSDEGLFTEVDHNGRYRATITDASGCTAKEEILINLPGPCNGFIASTDETVSNAIPVDSGTNMVNLASLIDIEGGTPPYRIENLFDSISDVESGFLDVNITDDQGCIFFIGVPFSGAMACKEIPLMVTHTLENIDFTVSTLPNYDLNSVTWSTGENNPSIFVTQPGPYAVEVQDINGCISTVTFDLID